MLPLPAVGSFNTLDSPGTCGSARPLAAPLTTVTAWALEPLRPLVAWRPSATSYANLPGLHIDIDTGVLISSLGDLRNTAE